MVTLVKSDSSLKNVLKLWLPLMWLPQLVDFIYKYEAVCK